ncbi:OmpH family outer membrane protein [Flagellimonas taeanensis]|jgi:outer membrane protein|uniref:Periplasmic chaperone for outer membrane proteins Skp n=1 Tax=Flagellimonas taeanensis TaxID=1005926 RepID=A0A1M6TNQ4_9FLAO|nr:MULTISPECIES: OmpH family outer membrane protein [Allomuricauda]MDC6384193.1 OmpH family outer membrane protein [Muricauda sp. SK9]MEE1962274.1 OmpH family outer membrane protein [Allomuricauda taeanensis]RIV49564.1 OmpH family outer membrane protein [Allomuricauda taeanensis]SFB89486.1 periplasmic chaperone for outer membrane proteins Skp [Allomuricauda taeanensis]SHK58529.1 periplasmic chaperone for outer membrane proteins Skp [Allomuricauda taeanensis]
MRNVKRIAVALVLFVAATGFMSAQSKVAHINVQQLLSDMPEMKAAQAELKKLQETYRADIQNSMKELQNKLTQYQNEATSKTNEENEQRALELQGFERNIQEAEQAAMQEMQKKQQELFAPISDKAKAAIEKVAAAQGFDYVIDASPGLSLIVAKGKDLLPEVKKELGF